MITTMINGVKHIAGRDIVINGNRITVDGKDVTPDAKEITIEVHGNVDKLQVDSCQKVTINGNAGSVKTLSGDVNCGDVAGSVSTMSGDVSCGSVGGSVSTMSGDIEHG